MTTTNVTAEQELKLTNHLLKVMIEHNQPARELLRTKRVWYEPELVNFDHDAWNQAIRDAFKREATYWDRAKTAYIKCLNKGHDWHVRSQEEYDKGYDEPMICWRCGEWDM